MKITKFILIGVIAFVVGLTGLIICLVPSQSGADSTISSYVSAINSGNTEKMQKSYFSPSDMGLDFDLNYGSDSSESSGDKKLNALNSSEFDFDDEGVSKVKSVKLVGCIDGETETYMNMTGVNVTAVIEIKYEDQEGESKTVFSQESFNLVKAKGKYKIVG